MPACSEELLIPGAMKPPEDSRLFQQSHRRRTARHAIEHQNRRPPPGVVVDPWRLVESLKPAVIFAQVSPARPWSTGPGEGRSPRRSSAHRRGTPPVGLRCRRRAPRAEPDEQVQFASVGCCWRSPWPLDGGTKPGAELWGMLPPAAPTGLSAPLTCDGEAAPSWRHVPTCWKAAGSRLVKSRPDPSGPGRSKHRSASAHEPGTAEPDHPGAAGRRPGPGTRPAPVPPDQPGPSPGTSATPP